MFAIWGRMTTIAPLNEMLNYPYLNAEPAHTQAYLLPTVLQEIAAAMGQRSGSPSEGRVFDLGCGNGATAAVLSQKGYLVVGVDPSPGGIGIANATCPHLRMEVGSCYDDLTAKYGQFHTVVSLEVVEHVFLPRKFAKCVFDLLEPGGTAVISTPYHGYWKNLAMAVTGRLDTHFTALWDYGHIKFWSIRTLTALLTEAGFHEIRFVRVGRIPVFAKSMIAVAKRPR